MEEPMSKQSGPMKQQSGRERFFPGMADQLWNDWRWQYRHRVREVEELARLLPFDPQELETLRAFKDDLHLAVTPYCLSLIDPDDPADPIRRQVVPSTLEFEEQERCSRDPLGEEAHTPVGGIVHKYPDRALFIATNICPAYCRYCTRRRKWLEKRRPKTLNQLDAMISYVRETPSIRDVLFSGGDPFSLSLPIFSHCLKALDAIPHVEIIRIATRYPVVLPQRFDEELLKVLSGYSSLWMVTHFNHPNELTAESAAACRKVLRAGIPVNNQSVLLRGVNDNVETMLKLCRGLLKIGVRPYYLFQCDPVQGAEHLRTSVWTGVKIIEKMRGFTSGLAVPTFVVDTEGGGKVPLNSNYCLQSNGDSLLLRNYEGKLFRYRNPPP